MRRPGSTPPASARWLTARLGIFRRDRRGVAAVEFALVLPLMLVMYIGMAVVTVGISIDRKLTIASRALADLAAQRSRISDSEKDNIFAAASAVMAPYSPAGAELVLFSVYIDSKGVARVCWSDGNKPGIAPKPGLVFTFPPSAEDLAKNRNSSVIVGQITYPYSTGLTGLFERLGVFGNTFVNGVLRLSETTYMRPRSVAQVARDGQSTCKVG